jgi:predicted nucleic acid-binding protein
MLQQVIKADPADNRVLECALESRAACIVTGDGHLLDLGQFEGIPILGVAGFLAQALTVCRDRPPSLQDDSVEFVRSDLSQVF